MAIAAGVRTVGAGVLIVIFATVAAIGPAAVAAAALRSGAPLASVLVGAGVVTAALVPQVTIRPQVVSFAFTGILLALLMRARPETRHRLWAIPPIMLLWANAHGFFIVGLGIGLVYLVATLLGRTPMREHRGLIAAIAAVSLVATMVTPSGPAGLLYALSFGDPSDVGAARIVEWQSPNFHNPQFLPFLALLGLLFLTGVRGAPGWMAIVALAGAAIGLFASRAIGVGSLMIMPLVVLFGPIRLPQRSGQERDPRTERARGWMELAAASLVAIVLVIAAAQRGPVAVDDRRAPVAGTELIRQLQPDARVLAAYEWGGYVINELHPLGGTVFVDGRMHKFAPQVLTDYLGHRRRRAGVAGPPGSVRSRCAAALPEHGPCPRARAGRGLVRGISR